MSTLTGNFKYLRGGVNALDDTLSFTEGYCLVVDAEHYPTVYKQLKLYTLTNNK